MGALRVNHETREKHERFSEMTQADTAGWKGGSRDQKLTVALSE